MGGIGLTGCRSVSEIPGVRSDRSGGGAREIHREIACTSVAVIGGEIGVELSTTGISPQQGQ